MGNHTTPGARSRQVRRTKAPKAAYPRLCGTENELFWLVALLRAQAECEALTEHATKLKAFGESPLENAIWVGIGYSKDLADRAATYCTKHGLLPYAHQHTAVLGGHTA